MRTISHSASAFSTAVRIKSFLSGVIGYTFASASISPSIPLKTVELNSIISPFSGSVVGATISSPVGIIPASGRLITSISVIPPAKSAPQSEGVSLVPEGAIISPIHISSPTCRTFCQGTAAEMI